jgi:hypothetical protein
MQGQEWMLILAIALTAVVYLVMRNRGMSGG